MLGSFLGAIIGITVSQTAAPILQPAATALSQDAYKRWPNALPGVADLVQMRWKNYISEDQYNDAMARLGYDTDWADKIFHDSERLLQGYDLIALARRDPDQWDTIKEELHFQGWTDQRIEQLQKVTEAIPSVRDVIEFAVREVYTPEIAERFGQYEKADEVYSQAEADLKANGISQENFRKYWAAHWTLPSLTQGYEMLHRGVITGDDLELLMEAADVMPFWRDKLKAISYEPYTRVDVRRMHKLGILTDDDLVRSYMDLGYDEEHANAMAEFTIRYNAEPEEMEMTAADRTRAQLQEGTRSAILKAYHDQILTRSEAATALEAIGIGPDAIELYLTMEDYKKEDEIISERIQTAHLAYTRSIWDSTKTIASLGELNLPGKQIDALMEKWDLEKRARPTKPTKAELFNFWKAGIISKTELINELRTMGYSDQYINWYIRYLQTKK